MVRSSCCSKIVVQCSIPCGLSRQTIHSSRSNLKFGTHVLLTLSTYRMSFDFAFYTAKLCSLGALIQPALYKGSGFAFLKVRNLQKTEISNTHQFEDSIGPVIIFKLINFNRSHRSTALITSNPFKSKKKISKC